MEYKNFKELLEKCNLTNKDFNEKILKGNGSKRVDNYAGKEVPTHYESLALFLSALHDLGIPYKDILNGTFFENIDKYKSPTPADETKLELTQDEINKLKEFLKNFK